MSALPKKNKKKRNAPRYDNEKKKDGEREVNQKPDETSKISDHQGKYTIKTVSHIFFFI